MVIMKKEKIHICKIEIIEKKTIQKWKVKVILLFIYKEKCGIFTKQKSVKKFSKFYIPQLYIAILLAL